MPRTNTSRQSGLAELEYLAIQQERAEADEARLELDVIDRERQLESDYGVMDYAKDANLGAGRGIVKFGSSVVGLLDDLNDKALGLMGDYDTSNTYLDKAKGWLDSQIEGEQNQTQTALGGITESVTQFALGFVPVARGLKGVSVLTGSAKATASRWAVAGIAADFVSFDAQEERLSNVVQQYPALANPVTEFLASSENDDEILGRAKNALEGIIVGEILGAGGKVVMASVRKTADLFGDSLKAHKAAKAAKADVKAKGEDARVLNESIEVSGDQTTEGAVRSVKPLAADATPDQADDLYTIFREGDSEGRIQFRYGDGHVTFRVDEANKVIELDRAHLEQAFRGRGIMGVAAYSRLIKWAEARGYSLTSDHSVSPSAQAVWKRLEDAGFKIERNPNVEHSWDDMMDTDPATAHLVSTDGNPVFRVVDSAQGKIVEPTLVGLEGTFKGVGVDNLASYGVVRLAQAARQGGAQAAEQFLDRVTREGVAGIKASDSAGIEVARMRLDHASVTDEKSALALAQGLVDEFEQVLNVLPEGKRVPWDRTIQNAAEMSDGFDPDAMAQSFLAQTLGGGSISAKQLAMRTLLGDTLNQITDLSKKIAAGSGTDADKVLRKGLVEKFGLYHAMWQQGRREIARALNAMKVTAELSGADRTVLRDAGIEDEALDKLFANVNPRDPHALREAATKVNKVLSPRWKDHAMTVMYGSLLSGPVTHARNIAGNLFNGVLGMVDNFAAIPFGWVRGRAAAVVGDDSYLPPSSKDAIAYAVGYFTGIKSSLYVPLRELAGSIREQGTGFSLKAWADEMEQNDLLGQAWRALKKGTSVSDPLEKLDGARRVETTGYGFYAKEFDELPGWVNDSNAFTQAAMKGLYKLTGAIVGTSSQVGRVLAFGDEVFSTGIREAVVRQEVVRRAVVKHAEDMAARANMIDLHGKDWADRFYPRERVEDYIHQGFVDFALDGDEAIEQSALEAARYGTFRNETALTRPLQSLSNVGKDIPGMPVPPLRLVLSFIRTPVSMMSQVYFDRMLAAVVLPVKFGAKGVRAVTSEVAAKGFNGEALEAAKVKFLNEIAAGGDVADKAAARALVGGSLVASTMMLAANGRITGGSPRGRDSKEGTGPEPYSIRIGDTWYTFNQTDPVGWIMANAVDIYFAIERAAEADDLDGVERVQEAGAALLMSVTNSLYSKSFFSGVAQLLDAMDGEDEGKLVRWFEKLPTMFVPLAAAGRYVENLIDPVRSDADGVIQQVLAMTPWASSKVAVRRDFLGREVKDADPQVILPTKQSRESIDPLDRELYRLGFKLTMPPRKFDKIVELTPEQYNALLRYRGQEVRIGGKTLEESLRAIVTSEWYQRTREASLTDPAKVAALEDVIKDEISRYTEFANDDIRIGKAGIPKSLKDVGAQAAAAKRKRAEDMSLVP